MPFDVHCHVQHSRDCEALLNRIDVQDQIVRAHAEDAEVGPKEPCAIGTAGCQFGGVADVCDVAAGNGGAPLFDGISGEVCEFLSRAV